MSSLVTDHELELVSIKTYHHYLFSAVCYIYLGRTLSEFPVTLLTRSLDLYTLSRAIKTFVFVMCIEKHFRGAGVAQW